MSKFVTKALTKKITLRGTRGIEEIIEIPPSEKLVLGVKFAIAITICLSAVEVAHMAFLGTWSSEVFAAISGLIGTVSGVLIGQRA
jgi:hypothetical protein